MAYTCTFTPFELISTPLDLVTFQPDSSLFWAGNLLQGKSIRQGLTAFAEVPIEISKRSPLVVSINLLTKDNIQRVDNPSQSNINNAIGTLIERATKAGLVSGSSISFKFAERYGNQQVALDIGLALENLSAQAQNSLNATPQANEITLTAYVIQKAFTVSVDFEGRSGSKAFINDSFTKDDLSQLENAGMIGEDNPPVYVSSVTYGRILIFSVTSEGELLEAAIRDLESTILGGELTEEQKQVLLNSKIEVFGVGGPAEAILSAIKNGDLSDYFEIGAPLTSMVPISFELKTINGSSAALVSYKTRYDLRQCEVNSLPSINTFEIITDKLKVTLKASISDPDGDSDLKEVIINWGDGQSTNIQNGFATNDFETNNLETNDLEAIEAEHNYAEAGKYTISLQATDNAGNSVNKNEEVIADLWYQPMVSSTWHWQLAGNINTSYNVDVYILNLFDTSKPLINQFHSEKRKVICRFSVGKYAPSLPDANDFSSDDLGNARKGSPEEFWIDIHSENVKKIMQGRLDLAAQKNCDGVQLDNIDSYRRDTGFLISLEDQISYNKFLADQAHERGLGAGLTNDIDQASKQADNFDFVINEQCHEFDECQKLIDFISMGKPVFNAEYLQSYKDNPDLLCPVALRSKLSTLILDEELDDSFRFSCNEDYSNVKE